VVYLQAAKQTAWEDCAGLKLTVVEATDSVFDCALAKTISNALETKVARKRILYILNREE
jgi:hypothetical protein